MELCAVALLAGAGYFVARARTSAPPSPLEQQAQMLQQSPNRTVGSAEGDRPSQISVYESRRLEEVRADETRRAGDVARRALDPATRGPGGSHAMGRGEEVVRSNLLGRDVPIERFTHNNMVPFYGGKVKQSTVDDAFSDKLEAFTGGFSLRPQGRKQEAAPSFSPAPQGVMGSGGRAAPSSDDAREAWLSTMQPSRNRANEAPGGLSPEIVGRAGVAGGQTGDVYYDMRQHAVDRGVDELRAASHPKLSFEGRVLPGKGTTLDERAPLPTVRERTFKPLVEEMTGVDQLLRTTGAVIADARRPDDLRDIRPNNRMTTTAASGYVGAAGGGAFVAADAREAADPFRTYKAQLGAPQVGPAAAPATRTGDHGRSSVLVYGNNRDVTTVAAPTVNLVSAFKALVAPLQDALRTTKKESNDVDAWRAFGNAAGGVEKMTVYDASDVARTTIKQLTAAAEAPLGNLVGGAGVSRLTAYDASDVARTTIKQLTAAAEAPLGNLVGGAGVSRLTAYDASDVARTTIKQLSSAAETPLGNLVGGAGVSRLTAYDASDVARTTIKQLTAAAEAPLGNLVGGAGVSRLTVYDPDQVMRTGRGETTLAEAPLGNLVGGAGVSKMTMYDPSDVARTTRMQTTLQDTPLGLPRGGPRAEGGVQAPFDPEAWRPPTTLRDVIAGSGRAGPQDGSVGALAGRAAGAYAGSASFSAPTTQREVSEGEAGTAFGGAAGLLKGGGYAVAPDDVRDTQKQILSDHDYFGGSVGVGAAKQSSHDSADAMRSDDTQEMLLQGREPTLSSVKVAVNVAQIGSVSTHGSGGLGEWQRPPVPQASVAVNDSVVAMLGRQSSPRRGDDLPLTSGADRLTAEATASALQRASNPVALGRLQ